MASGAVPPVFKESGGGGPDLVTRVEDLKGDGGVDCGGRTGVDTGQEFRRIQDDA